VLFVGFIDESNLSAIEAELMKITIVRFFW